jgi:hypothetical protein
MAEKPAFIGTPKSTSWTLVLSTQTSARYSTPPSNSIAVRAGAQGSFLESIIAYPLGSNVSTVLLMFCQKGVAGYYYMGSAQLDATTGPGVGDNTGMEGVNLSDKLLPICLFPASNTTTPNRGLRIAAGDAVYLALDRAVASGWSIVLNGGDL